MGEIYKITNTINDKIYVGQTTRTAAIRWKEHQKNIQALKHRLPLYKALDKYGVDNFVVEVLEICEDNQLNEKEVYWIKKLESFGEKGYNCTVGGQGNTIKYDISLDIEIIAERYQQGERLDLICKQYNHDYLTVKRLLEERGIMVDTMAGPKKVSKQIYQINPQDFSLVASYPSISAAARAICEEGKNPRAIANHLSKYKDTDTVSHGYLWKTKWK
jgi:group I intron endonuclease